MPITVPSPPVGAIALDDGATGALDTIALDDGTTGTLVETRTVPLEKTVGAYDILLLLTIASQSPYPG